MAITMGFSLEYFRAITCRNRKLHGLRMGYYVKKGKACLSYGQRYLELIMHQLVDDHPRNTGSIKSEKRQSNGSSEAGTSTKTPRTLRIEAEDIKYNPTQDEIGEGCFGCVYRARLYGTEVAYKVIKAGKRNASKVLLNVVEGEIMLHSSFQHSKCHSDDGVCTDTNNSWPCVPVHVPLSGWHLI